MTKPLSRFWRALDQIPEATTDQREWLLLLRDDWAVAKQYLTPTGRLASQTICPSPGGNGCPRKIVKISDESYRAVCGNALSECDAVEMTLDEIACLALDRNKLERDVLRVLNCERVVGRKNLIGRYPVLAGIAIPVFLAIPGPTKPSWFELLPEEAGPAILVAPTLNSFAAAPPKRQDHVLLALSEMSGVDEQGQLMSLSPPERLLSSLREKIVDSAHAGEPRRIWMLPPEAHWEALTLEVTDNQRLNVRFRDQIRTFGPEEFGLTNQRTRKVLDGWGLLLVFAAHGGRIPRPQPTDRQRVQKRKQLLCDRLTEAFGIPDEPIRWSDEDQCYRTRFLIRDSRPRGARESSR